MSESSTPDINRIKQSAEFQKLADRLWEKWEGRRVTLDPRGRPNRLAFTNFLARAIAAAYEAGVPDPYKDIDWETIIDPELEQAENLSAIEQWLGARTESRLTAPGETEEGMLRSQIDALEEEIEQLGSEIESGIGPDGEPLTPRQIEDLRRQRDDLEDELEALRRELEELERRRPSTPESRATQRPRRARPAPTPAPAPQPPTAAPAPAQPVSEEQRLWELFSVTLAAAGLDPSQYREDFEAEYRRVADRPYDDKLSDIMRFASEIVRTNRPRPQPPAATAEAIARQVEETLRRELESLAERLSRPATPQEYLSAAGAELASVPPGTSIEMVPVSAVNLTPEECGGHDYIWAPDADALGLMRGYGVSTWVTRKFFTCPERWWGEANGSTDLEFTVETMREINEVPRLFADWLMELAKAIDNKYEQEGRLRGITRLSEFRKRHRGPITSVGR